MSRLRSNRALNYIMEHPRIPQGVLGGFLGLVTATSYTNRSSANRGWKVGGATAAGIAGGAALSPKAFAKVEPWLEYLG